MNDQTDQQLLRDYAERQSEAAFAAIVHRYIDLVYSVAFRLSCDAHAAKDVTQGVFVALAQNAPQLTDRPALAGWLHGTARNLAAKTVRTDVRRRAREQEAAVMNELLSAHPDAGWEHIAPHLDEALGELSEPDRDAVLLRYFKNHDLRTVGATLGISDDAAQKRVSRAVERLREFFAKRGVTVGASGLTVVISANAVQAAPVGLALTISTAAALTGTTLATTATVTATKTLAMTALQKTIVTATMAVLAGAGIYEARQASQLRKRVQTLEQQQGQLSEQLKATEAQNNQLSNSIVEAHQVKVLLPTSSGGNITDKNHRASISLSELEARLRATASLPESQRQPAIGDIASSIELHDPAQAIGIANRVLTSFTDRDLFMRAVLMRWVDADPKSTAEYVLTLPANGVRKELLQSTLGAWAKTDPDAAIKFADVLPAGVERDWALCYVAYFWTGSDATAAWNWATSLPAGETRVLSIQAVLRQLATKSLNDAANLAVQLSGDEQVRAVRALITDSAVTNPTGTAAWVHDFPAGDARDKAVEMLVKRWAERDPVAASDWLLQEPQDKGFQDAAKQLVGKTLKVSPELAWDWATKLTDAKIRKQQLQYVAKQWMGFDQTAARAKIQASNLPAEEVEKLLAQPQ